MEMHTGINICGPRGFTYWILNGADIIEKGTVNL